MMDGVAEVMRLRDRTTISIPTKEIKTNEMGRRLEVEDVDG